MRISIERVSFSYAGGPPVLRDIDLNVASGEFLALVGPNGSGKSTLLKVVSGILRPSTGAVRLGNDPVDSLSVRRLAQRLALVSQERPLGFDFTVREVVAMGRTAHRGRFARETARDRGAIDRAMKSADVEDLAARSIRGISGGERQRVFLATALAQDPAVLLLDEPTTHLDLAHQVRFLSIVRRSSVAGMTVMMAIHDLTLAAQSTERTVLLSAGRIAAIDRTERVLTGANLRNVFGVEVATGFDSRTHAPYVLPILPQEHASTARSDVKPRGD